MPQNQNFRKDVLDQAQTQTTPKPNDFIVGDGRNPEDYWLSQRDNKYHPSVTCFPTSVAMVVTYVLLLLGKTKADIGITNEEQIEDYITKDSVKSTMLQWMVRTVGSWTRQYFQKAWTVAKMEEKIFDDLLRQFGFDAVFVDQVKFDEVCDMLIETNMPMVISGDYKKVSTVGGHMTCVVGCNRPNRELLINDPFGYAYSQYVEPRGVKVRYKWDDFYKRYQKDGENATWVLKFVRT